MIRAFLEQRFQSESVAIRDVIVQRDQDMDGDDILRISVVAGLAADRLTNDQTRGLPRALRARLAVKKEEAFPILSFMAEREAKVLGAAA
ncbi:MAG: hypothetical protein ORN49_02235 [Rhodobacteraceae bacterium]|nr:hypothetical protein [Paracoccaceae bacterium]